MHSEYIQPIPLIIDSEPSPCSSSLPTPATISRDITSDCARRKPVLSKFANADVSTQPNLSDSTSARPSHISTIWGSSRKRGYDDHDYDDENPFADASASEMPVLSSQTQEVDIQFLQTLTDRFLVPPVFRLPPPPERKLACNSSDSDSDGFVQSSQSQHILPHHISPHRKSADQLFDSIGSSLADNSTLEEIVPSSQSQTELEVNMSLRISQCLTHVKLVRAGCVHGRLLCPLLMRFIHVRQRTTSPSLRNDLPSAPELDIISPVPIHDTISSKESTAEGLEHVSVDPTDRITEGESEDESSIQVSGGEITEGTAEYMNSLPHTVQDFEVMFGESSGSLPGDFPLPLP